MDVFGHEAKRLDELFSKNIDTATMPSTTEIISKHKSERLLDGTDHAHVKCYVQCKVLKKLKDM